MGILKSSFVVSGWTGISRVMGFVRDIVIANKLGTSAASDAFFIAMLLPNLFRRLFAEGAFNVAFVPILSQIQAEKGQKAAEEFAAPAFTWLLLALLAVNLFAQVFMEYIIMAISFTPGNKPEQFDLAVLFGRITFPYLFFITLASLMGGICNTYRSFAPFAFMPILLNVAYLSCLFVLPTYGFSPAMAASIAIPAGGVLQAGFMVWALRKLKFKLTIKWPPTHEKLGDLLHRLMPAAVTVGFLQLSFIIDNKFAANLASWVYNPHPWIEIGENATSYLNYANKFYQFPLSLIGIAVATVLLPHFAAALQRQDHAAVARNFNAAFIASLALAGAATAGLFILAVPLMKTFFMHGDFTLYSAQMSGWAMMAYCLGLPGFIATKITSTAFYANGDTKTPVRAVAYTLIVNIIANILFMQYLGHVGIAAATALSGWLNAGLQLYWLKKDSFIEINLRQLAWPLVKATILSFVILGILMAFQESFKFSDIFIYKFVWIISAVALGGVSFIAGIQIAGLYDLKPLISRFTRLTKR